jgi:hypothetical protein
MTRSAFAYAQARLQARHGQRPGPLDWRRLQGVEDVAHYLQVARRTRLATWVEELHGSDHSDVIELVLRRRFCTHIDEVRGWLPQPWRDSSAWLKRLPDLPAIQYLLSGQEPPAWMSRDLQLRPFTQRDSRQRRQALRDSDCAPLVAAWERGETLLGAWFRHWNAAWTTQGRQGLEQLSACLRRFVQSPATVDGEDVGIRPDILEARLVGLFRRYSFQPAACYAHLALTALDLMRLRAELLRRTLFTGVEASAE